MQRFLPTLLITATLALPAFAGWRVDYPNSNLTFTGKQANTEFKGTFKSYIADINFDPTKLDTSTIHVTIDMTSAVIEGDKQQNEALPTKDWFFTEQFPKAVFTSTKIRETARGHYVADGKLTIRDMQKQISLPFTLDRENDAFRAKGNVILYRNDYNLGGKQWADDKWIAYPVLVEFSILARAQ